MKNKSYMPLLVLITVICVILGLFIHVGGSLIKINASLFNLKESNTTDFSDDYSGVSEINLDIDLAKITIKKGDTLNVSYKGKEDLAPSVKKSGDKLTIDQKSSVKPSVFGMDNIYSEIIITVPEGSDIKELSIATNLGDLTVEDVEIAEELSISADLGSIKLNNASAPEMDISAEMGSIEVKKSSFTDMSVSADMGSVLIEKCDGISEYSMDFSANMGSITVFGESKNNSYSKDGDKGSIEADLSMGSLTVK